MKPQVRIKDAHEEINTLSPEIGRQNKDKCANNLVVSSGLRKVSYATWYSKRRFTQLIIELCVDTLTWCLYKLLKRFTAVSFALQWISILIGNH